LDNNNDNNNLVLDKLRQIINSKVKENKNQIHPLHTKKYNDNLQIEIHSLRWILERATSQIQINQVRCLVEKDINNLGKKMND